MSKNAITIEQLQLVCRHHQEMMEVGGISENLSIRTLELLADVYAKCLMGGSATPHHVNQVSLWSSEAKKLKSLNPELKPRDCLVVEHGTPRREFARRVFGLYLKHRLTSSTMNRLVERYWRLAVISLAENERLNRIARSKMFVTPEERWRKAKIKFPSEKKPRNS